MDFTHSSASRYILTVLASLLVVTALILVALNAYQGQHMLVGSNQSYKDGFEAARTMYTRLCPMPQTTQQFTGIVSANDGKTLTVTQTSLDTDPTVDNVSNDRTVTVSATTVIQSIAQRTPEQMAQMHTTTTPPSPVSITSISVQDVHLGDAVVVSSDQNVRLLSTIPAVKIQVLK